MPPRATKPRPSTLTLSYAFSNNAADAFVLSHPDDQSVIYVCWKKVSIRHGGNDLSIGRFTSMVEAQRAILVRWRYDIADGTRSGLVEYLRVQKSKRAAAEISPIG